jgi:hypothetical protein
MKNDPWDKMNPSVFYCHPQSRQNGALCIEGPAHRVSNYIPGKSIYNKGEVEELIAYPKISDITVVYFIDSETVYFPCKPGVGISGKPSAKEVVFK